MSDFCPKISDKNQTKHKKSDKNQTKRTEIRQKSDKKDRNQTKIRQKGGDLSDFLRQNSPKQWTRGNQNCFRVFHAPKTSVPS